jgi:O-antigen/teichoic acid export membrane protein
MGLSRSVAWNVVGICLPLLVGVAVVPTIIRGLGVERFGCLSIIWTIIGYFSVFDLGLSRTLTKLIADRRAVGQEEEIPSLVVTALIVVLISGLTIAGIVILSAKWLTAVLFSATGGLQQELYSATIWLAIGLPFVLLATAITGLLEGFERFAELNLVRVPFGAMIYVVPLVARPFGGGLGLITALTVCVRLINLYVLALSARKAVPYEPGSGASFRRDLLRPLFNYGGWLTVSNVIGPIMVYFDRFFIAVVLGSAAVAYYTVPYDVLTRLWVVPTAVQGVLFPAFAIMRGTGSKRIIEVFARSIRVTLLVMLPLFAVGILLPFEALRLWVGAGFATQSGNVAQILIVGVLINALARYPFALVQSFGYANWAAMVHTLELPLYALALVVSLYHLGIMGAAYAWTTRICIDAVVFFVLSARLEPRLNRICARAVGGVFVICAAAVALIRLNLTLTVRIAAVIVLCGLCGALLVRDMRGRSLSAVPSG